MTFENIEIAHLRHALWGMCNAMNGCDKSDTVVMPAVVYLKRRYLI